MSEVNSRFYLFEILITLPIHRLMHQTYLCIFASIVIIGVLLKYIENFCDIKLNSVMIVFLASTSYALMKTYYNKISLKDNLKESDLTEFSLNVVYRNPYFKLIQIFQKS